MSNMFATVVTILGFFSSLVSGQTELCPKGPNTIGECGCDGQIWVADGCHEGFYCDSSRSEGDDDVEGCQLKCGEDETLLIDPRLGGSWQCVPDDNSAGVICPGKFNTVCGCQGEDEDCPIGDCECDGQLRVSNDCKEAKYCDGGEINTISCLDPDDIVFVNLVTLGWSCQEDDGRCPGAFSVGCEPDENYPTQNPPTEEPENGSIMTVLSPGALAIMAIISYVL